MKLINFLVLFFLIEAYNSVDAQGSSPVIRITPRNLRIIREGGGVRFACRATVGDSEVPVTWAREDKKPISSRFIEESPGVMALKEAALDDAGVYECRVGDSVASTKLEVDPKVKKEPEVEKEPETQQLNVTEGDNLSFQCSSSKPTVEMIFPNGTRINSNNSGEINVNLTDIQIDQAGRYECAAEDGDVKVKYFDVTVFRRKIPIDDELEEKKTEDELEESTTEDDYVVTSTTDESSTTDDEEVTESTTEEESSTTEDEMTESTTDFEIESTTEAEVTQNSTEESTTEDLKSNTTEKDSKTTKTFEAPPTTTPLPERPNPSVTISFTKWPTPPSTTPLPDRPPTAQSRPEAIDLDSRNSPQQPDNQPIYSEKPNYQPNYPQQPENQPNYPIYETQNQPNYPQQPNYQNRNQPVYPRPYYPSQRNDLSPQPRMIPHTVNHGEKVQLNCEAEGSTVRTNWRRGDEKPWPRGTQISGGKFTIEDIDFDAIGNYECYTNSRYGPVVTLIAQIQVVPGPPKITLESPKSVALGDNVVIICHPSGHGQIRTQWSFDGRDGMPEGVEAVDNVLRFNRIDYSHQGRYICTANSNYGSSTKATVISLSPQMNQSPPFLPVRYPTVQTIPIISIPPIGQRYIGDTIVLRCHDAGGYQINQHHWMRANGALPTNCHRNGGVLTINNAQPENSGRYICRLHFTNGRSTESFTDVSIKQRQCNANEFSCDGNSKCLPLSVKCDGMHQCMDRSDEKNCPVCDFKCPDGACFTSRERCNGRYDCRDGSDELNCIRSAPVRNEVFQCTTDRHYIAMSRRCDGRIDCLDGSDEQNCVSRCRPGEFQCPTGFCINAARKCDGRYDCPFGVDELNCGN